MQWDDARKTLTIGQRQGQFPGMLTQRQFRVRLVGSDKTHDVNYQGGEMSVAW